MDFNKIKSGLERLSRLADGWEHNGVSALERDIALDELREIYSAIRFAAADDVAKNIETAHPDMVEAAPVPMAEQNAVEVPETAVPVPEQPEKQPEKGLNNHTSENSSEERSENHTSEAHETSVATKVPAAEIVEPSAAADAAEQVATSAEQPAVEDIAADNVNDVECSSSSDKSEAQNLGGVQSLFDEDELPVGNRRRLIMMSLYGDDAAAAYSDEKNDSAAERVKAAEHRVADTEPVADVLRDTPTNDEAAAVNDVVRNVGIGARVVDRAPANDYSAPSVKETTDGVSQLLETEQMPESELVLGEVINNDLRTVADTITPALNIAETAGREHVDDLNEAIGINDRFLLIRDLFGGRTSVYEEAIRKINGFGNLDDCMVYIVENFDWNPNADATKLLMQLIERKYNR